MINTKELVEEFLKEGYEYTKPEYKGVITLVRVGKNGINKITLRKENVLELKK